MSKKAYLGSSNKVKVAATKKVLEPLEYDVVSIQAKSMVDNQPKSDEETITGAINRARELPSDGLRIGLEAGVQYHLGKLFLTNWGALIDEQETIYIAGGTRIPLPKEIEFKIINEHKELAIAMEEFTSVKDIRSKQGAIGIFTQDFVKREDIFIHIVKLLYGQYLHKRGE
jgi:inosine/xanthosine triphosphatase